jgi:hypothetical protein
MASLLRATLLRLATLACWSLLSAGTMGIRTVSASEAPVYEMGFRNMTNLQADLFQALDRKQQGLAAPSAVLLGGMRLPCIASLPGVTGSSADKGAVQLSAGFIDFINHVAHAKAIDESDRGFLVRYTAQFAQNSGNSTMPEFAALPSPKERTFQIMNRQASHFNQMAGGLIAIDLAHQYLGHYSRRSRDMASDVAVPTPVNTLITEQEWRDAVLRGASNALSCGLGTDGLRSLFDSFDRMETRPPWAAYFIHPKANVGKISAELGRLERDFFVMNREMQKSR